MKKKPKKKARKLVVRGDGNSVQQGISNSQINNGKGNSNVQRQVVAPSEKKETPQPSKKAWYVEWPIPHLLGAVLAGAIIGYFGAKYAGLHFGDTWLGASAVVSVLLLLRNPARVYLRWATFCLACIGGFNILSQLDLKFQLSDKTDAAGPFDLLFQLGFDDAPVVTLVLGAVAAYLFFLDYRMRQRA